MLKLGKTIFASRIVKQMLAERQEEQREEGDMQFDDPQIKDIRKRNPSKVKDKTEPAKGVTKPTETTPKGKDVPKLPSDKDLKTKYTNLANYVPADIKRDDDEVPTIKFDWDEDKIEGSVNVFVCKKGTNSPASPNVASSAPKPKGVPLTPKDTFDDEKTIDKKKKTDEGQIWKRVVNETGKESFKNINETSAEKAAAAALIRKYQAKAMKGLMSRAGGSSAAGGHAVRHRDFYVDRAKKNAAARDKIMPPAPGTLPDTYGGGGILDAGRHNKNRVAEDLQYQGDPQFRRDVDRAAADDYAASQEFGGYPSYEDWFNSMTPEELAQFMGPEQPTPEPNVPLTPLERLMQQRDIRHGPITGNSPEGIRLGQQDASDFNSPEESSEAEEYDEPLREFHRVKHSGISNSEDAWATMAEATFPEYTTEAKRGFGMGRSPSLRSVIKKAAFTKVVKPSKGVSASASAKKYGKNSKPAKPAAKSKAKFKDFKQTANEGKRQRRKDRENRPHFPNPDQPNNLGGKSTPEQKAYAKKIWAAKAERDKLPANPNDTEPEV